MDISNSPTLGCRALDSWDARHRQKEDPRSLYIPSPYPESRPMSPYLFSTALDSSHESSIPMIPTPKLGPSNPSYFSWGERSRRSSNASLTSTDGRSPAIGIPAADMPKMPAAAVTTSSSSNAPFPLSESSVKSSSSYLSGALHPLNSAMSPKTSHNGSPLIPPAFLLNLKDDGPEKCVGTPDYLAPESVLGMGQDAMVDWVSIEQIRCAGLLLCLCLSFVAHQFLFSLFSLSTVGFGRHLLRVPIRYSTIPRRNARAGI